ncbi:MOZ/SAS-like protein [Macleaya cordata]|uniref:Histone acetyltransferase n=1 Tax=Macleaya cordata TaxID=56857 RepID=A0A200QT77_MACCD|nr:MOZ/SAS-like protein [Macleaya cordata]
MASRRKTRARTRTRGESSSRSNNPVNQKQKQPNDGTASANSLEDDSSKKKNADALPVNIGNHLLCRWKDGNYHLVKIIQQRKSIDGGPDNYEYYVHYTEFNRRLDEWVKLEQLDLNSIQTIVEEEVEGKLLFLFYGHEELDPEHLHEHERLTEVKNIEIIELGRYEMDTWYFSPCDPEYNDCKKLFFCEFCLNFFKRKERLQRHLIKCDLKHPPGNEIYRNGKLSVDGKKNPVYCANLCFLAKLFLDHKTPCNDVNTFLFYILCKCDDRGYHIVAYFSKEKNPEEANNLACILTLPPYQKNGYGKFLIAFSYELSKKEGKVGTPERPLSDLGSLSYRGYWTRVILDILIKRKRTISIKELSEMTAIQIVDIMNTLRHLNLLQYKKGRHTICLKTNVLHSHLKATHPAGIEIDITKLIWTPHTEEK